PVPTCSSTGYATRSWFTRCAPLAVTRIGRSVRRRRNTSDFTIWSTRQPSARAASTAVRAEASSSTTRWPPPSAASLSWTRSRLAVTGSPRLRLALPRNDDAVERLRVGVALGVAQLSGAVTHPPLHGGQVLELARLAGERPEREVHRVGHVADEMGILPPG